MSQKGSKSPNLVLEKEIPRSKAWLSLSGIAPKVYMLFLLRRRMEKAGKNGKHRWICTNGRELIFPYREAKDKFGITQPRFTRSIDMLIDRGFLDIVHPGNGTAKEPTIYGLSVRWKNYGKPDFVTVKRIKVKRGFCDRPPKQS